MAKIVMYFGQSFGMLSKSYPIVQQLVRSGHTINYISLSQSVREYLEPLGVRPISSSFTLSDRPKKSGRRNFYAAQEHFECDWFSDMDWASRKINEFKKIVDEIKPDLIVESWGVFTNIISKISKIPCVSITHGCYHPERLYDKLRWWEDNTKEMPSKLLEDINEIFANYGVPAISKFEELFTGDYTLIPNIPELDPLTNSNRFNTHYVAPMIWDNQNHLDQDTLNFNSEWPTIFCYTGKLKDASGTKDSEDNELLHLILKSLSNEKFNILLAVGKQNETGIAQEEQKRYFPSVANISIASNISISDAFNMADMVIHHGGYGSCISQLVYAKASVIIPTNSEREYNARMCEKLGLGICIPFENANPDILKNSVHNVLRDKSYINCAMKYNSLLKERKYPTAGDMIEKILFSLK